MVKILIVIACVALFWKADASVEESQTLRIFNPNSSGIPLDKLKTLIEQADLPSLGYKKITETKTETDLQTGLLVKKNAVRFLKEMPCSDVPAAEEMLNELFPGILGDDVLTRTKSEIENLGSNQECISGIEFHLKPCEYRRTRRGVAAKKGHCDGCNGCTVVIVKKDKCCNRT